MRILSFGSKKYAYLSQLYAALKRHECDLSVDCLILKNRSGKSIANDGVFNATINKRFTIQSFIFCFSGLPKLLLGFLYSFGILVLDPRGGVRSCGFVLSNFYKISLIQHVIKRYSIIHVHYCTARNMTGVFFLPQNARVVCTYWGSDLFRHQGVLYNFWSRKALERADGIIVSSLEMSETILSEFGRHLKQKIQLALFIPEFRLIQLIDQFSVDEKIRKAYRDRMNFPQKIIITVGNNASEGNNHLKILAELDRVSSKFKNVYFILPLTYGRKEEYCERLEAFREKSELQILFINEFMTWDDLALLRISTDIMIMMPESDAMSAALAESMYAGSVVVAGAWLPYGRFRGVGCFFETADNFTNIPAIIENILTNFDDLKERSNHNKKLLKEVYYNEPALAKAWLDAYKKAISSSS